MEEPFMAHAETFNEQSKRNGPQILELLSELEKRDKGSKGGIQSGSVVGAGVSDPRGASIVNSTGHDVGKVTDLYVDPHTRLPHFALLALGNHALGIGDRSVLVGFEDIEFIGDRRVRVRATLPAGYGSAVQTVAGVSE
jgi:sporulation protein YlmC with PRC-barrel domain